MSNHNLIITPLDNPPLVEMARKLPNVGVVKCFEGLVYLAIDHNFIDKLYPYIKESHFQKPDYFSIGAHISIIYPNEAINPEFEFNRKIHFSILNLFKAQTHDTSYIVLTVHSPELIQLRKMNNLSEKLNLNGYIVELHTTIGRISKGAGNESI